MSNHFQDNVKNILKLKMSKMKLPVALIKKKIMKLHFDFKTKS